MLVARIFSAICPVLCGISEKRYRMSTYLFLLKYLHAWDQNFLTTITYQIGWCSQYLHTHFLKLQLLAFILTSDLECDLAALRRWLNATETCLLPMTIRADWTNSELEERLKHHQVCKPFLTLMSFHAAEALACLQCYFSNVNKKIFKQDKHDVWFKAFSCLPQRMQGGGGN